MSQWNDHRRTLLQTLANIGAVGRAEGEKGERIAKGFFPVTEHLRLLDPEVVLVVGPRGSGKTEIARVLTDADLYKAVSRYAPAVRLPSGSSKWIKAYPFDEAQGFEVLGLRSFVQSSATASENSEKMRDLWFAYLIRTLESEVSKEDKISLEALFEAQGASVEAIAAIFSGLATKPVIALDRLDSKLSNEDRYIFVTYDELDVLGAGEWSLIEAGVRGLVAFWATYARRWKRIRAKLFLRTDNYERHAQAGGADLAKLAAGRVDLIWNDRDLYGMLLKRLANLDRNLAEYVQAVKAITWQLDAKLGKIPRLRQWQDARPLVERMVGVYMGANQKKGLVYRWMIDHVRDGLGRALPRPFMRLIEEAARQEMARFGFLREPRLIEPASLRRALDRVSNEYVVQSADEWPWLSAVKSKLTESALVPWDRERDVIKLLEGFVSSPIPPYEGRELLEYLLEIGVLRRRPDGRVDAPDLFLSGLGLRRKGGVRKRG